jgi:hypothetical protein
MSTVKNQISKGDKVMAIWRFGKVAAILEGVETLRRGGPKQVLVIMIGDPQRTKMTRPSENMVDYWNMNWEMEDLNGSGTGLKKILSMMR